MTNYKAFLIDLDGTMYKGKTQIDGAKDFIEALRVHNIPFLFVTNNTTRSNEEAAKFLADYHDISVQADQFYTSVDALVFELTNAFPNTTERGNAYVIGSKYLSSVVESLGFTVDNNWEDTQTVVVGLDQNVLYSQIAEAAMALQNGANFFLTNPDIQFPNDNGLYVPGAGVLGQAISETAGSIKPVVCGKPSPVIIEGALNKLGLEKSDAVMLGDKLLTDINAAINAGVDTILIETGVNSRDDIEKLDIIPTYIANNYAELIATCFKN